ncbi:hypothetical protein KUW14_02245 [Pseudooceanicola nitratireducens]|nr:hypothetical protein [Pseudooceanicola nitratireducens]MBY6164656.1 hypothetical protein [Pseudooceanicola nitratireducens]MEC7298159.1 hypothetical protein [Pseudomonadota bacterium]
MNQGNGLVSFTLNASGAGIMAIEVNFGLSLGLCSAAARQADEFNAEMRE